jgi:hypothetical protein
MGIEENLFIKDCCGLATCKVFGLGGLIFELKT